jgi:hypothetical protein
MALALALVSCTPGHRGPALVGVGAMLCGGGLAAEAAGQSWGAILSAAGCWLADWAAEREERRRAAERNTLAFETETAPAITDPIDAAAVELARAHAEMVAVPCAANAAALRNALERCQRLDPR